jgi:hypothetical protein
MYKNTKSWIVDLSVRSGRYRSLDNSQVVRSLKEVPFIAIPSIGSPSIGSPSTQVLREGDQLLDVDETTKRGDE